MNDVVREWVAKAQADFGTAGREMQAGPETNYDAVCFHAQQCAEKLLKALLIARGATPPKTHDLLVLHRLLMPVCAEWSWPESELRLLTRAAVDFRYPGESAEQREAAAALDVCTRMRARLLPLLEAS